MKKILSHIKTGPVSEYVKEQLLKDFLTFIRPAMPSVLILEFIYLYLVMTETDGRNAGLWFSAMFGSISIAMIFGLFINKISIKRKYKEIILLILLIFTFGSFGLSLPYYYPLLPFGYVNLLVILIAGIIGGLSSIASPQRTIYLVSAFAISLPETIYFAMQEDFTRQLLAVLIPFYIATMFIFVMLDHVRRVRFIETNRNLDIAHRELAENHDRLKQMKKKQDGDYFLTSLLIEPLGRNNYRGDACELNFLIRDHKRFRFNKWRKGIGGDLNIAENIQLGNKQYAFFLNADAMGKSIQGAGGALVLGAVMQSILMRIQARKPQIFPEHFLQESIDELQRVFNQFQGSMLISLIMGLIDEETGILYYINAEHPFLVLLRDKKSEFLENSIGMHKIGVITEFNTVPIFVRSLSRNDIIVAGSDGRDDLITDSDKREIQNDEARFLEIIEKYGDRSMRKIYSALRKYGRLSDDLSLIKVKYNNDPEPLRENLLQLKKEFAQAKKNHDFAALADKAARIADISVADASYLRKAAAAHWQSGNTELALSFAYRYYRRFPFEGKAISLLATMYARLRQEQLRDRFVSLGLKIAPEHRDWHKIGLPVE